MKVKANNNSKAQRSRQIKQVKEWYHYCRRKGPYYPYPVQLFNGGFCEGRKKGSKDSYFELIVLVFRNNGWGDVYYRQKDFYDVQRDIFEKIQKDENYTERMLNEFKKRAKLLSRACKELEDTDISNRELVTSVFKEFHKRYIGTVLYGGISHWGGSKPLGEYLENYISKKTKKSLVSDYFAVLSSPLDPSFVFRERVGLLELAQKINKNPELKKLFNSKASSQILKALKGNTLKALKQHTKNFEWVPFDYNGPTVYDEVYYIKEIKKLIKEGGIDEEIKRRSDYFKDLQQRQKDLFTKLKIDAEHKRLFKDLQTLVWHKDFKKEQFTKVHVMLWRFLRKLAKQRKIDFKDFRFLTYRELEEFVATNNLNVKEVAKRKEFCLVSTTMKGVIMFTGSEGRAISKHIANTVAKQEQFSRKSDIIKGMAASKGKVQGTVQLIPSPGDVKNMKKGKILVTSMTTPVFVPAMKLASAIVTDEGGITCHAATISREMNKPCIIGTKIATQVLKDGDMVEVDANKGIVKKLS